MIMQYGLTHVKRTSIKGIKFIENKSLTYIWGLYYKK